MSDFSRCAWFGVLFGLLCLVGRMGYGGLSGFHQVGRLPARMALRQCRVVSIECRVLGAATEVTLLLGVEDSGVGLS